MGLKQILSLKSLFLFVVLLSVGFFIYQTNTSNLTSERKTVETRAATASTVKIMTFNVLGEPLCAQGRDHRGDMRAIVDFVKNNGISIANLQEVKESHDDDDDGCEYDLLSNIEDEVAARASTYKNFSREYISANQGSASSKWYRMFLYNIPLIGAVSTSSVASSNSQGAEAIVVNTSLGPIRFINLHPQPGTQGLTVHNMLVPFVNQFKGDGIPIVIMGDFNLRYDFADAAPVLKAIEDAGFYRACDPVTFPNGGCNDTVKGSSNFTVDHIFIDKRASFRVKNAYVEQSMQFSDHLPVVVELEESVAELPNPTGLSYTCNADGTATFRWDAVSGAQEYGFRLDRQPPYDWYNAALDTIRNTNSTSITVPALSGVQYQWAVTAVITPGTPHGLPAWQPAFTCTSSAPTLTHTPTPTLTPTPTGGVTITELPDCARRSEGDSNCDGRVDMIDYACWRNEFITKTMSPNCKTSDYNGLDGVSILDFAIWNTSFVRVLP